MAFNRLSLLLIYLHVFNIMGWCKESLAYWSVTPPPPPPSFPWTWVTPKKKNKPVALFRAACFSGKNVCHPENVVWQREPTVLSLSWLHTIEWELFWAKGKNTAMATIWIWQWVMARCSPTRIFWLDSTLSKSEWKLGTFSASPRRSIGRVVSVAIWVRFERDHYLAETSSLMSPTNFLSHVSPTFLSNVCHHPCTQMVSARCRFITRSSVPMILTHLSRLSWGVNLIAAIFVGGFWFYLRPGSLFLLPTLLPFESTLGAVMGL